MKPYIDLLAQFLQWTIPAVLTLVGVYMGSRANTKTEILRNEFEERRRISTIRISAIERCAQLLHADHDHLAAVRSAAISAKPFLSSKDPGVEAIGLLQIYFPFEVEEPTTEYARARLQALESLRQCAIQAALAASVRLANPASGMNDNDRAVVKFRDEAAEYCQCLKEAREKIVSELSKLIRTELGEPGKSI